MINSMTGFGHFESITDEYRITVDLKSVNHRYLDLSIKLPRQFNIFESSIREQLKKYVKRGKVDLGISYESYTDKDELLFYNHGLAEEYMEYFKSMSEEFNIQNDIRVSALARFPDVLTMKEAPQDEIRIRQLIFDSLKGAADQFNASRNSEGSNLADDLQLKLTTLNECLSAIEIRAPRLLEIYNSKLHDKVSELLSQSAIDESRIAAEVTLYADRVCVDEEIVRLHSHIKALSRELIKGGTVGKKLDFIAQEMNREANTILSKSTDLETSDQAIELKTTIEKIREQVQNIE